LKRRSDTATAAITAEATLFATSGMALWCCGTRAQAAVWGVVPRPTTSHR
jgi:hypothetical protein